MTAKPTLEDKMARAIAIDAGESWEHLPENLGDHLPKISKDCYRSMARAALAVVMAEMREPSETVIEAGFDQSTTWRAEVKAIFLAAVAQFEKEQAGG